MSIYDSLNQNTDMQAALRQMQSDPSGMLKRAGFNVPSGMKSPEQMVKHILQTGQGGPRAQMAQMMMQRMGLK